MGLSATLYGFIIGIALGVTGGGGSIITVPVLIYLVGESVHAAIGTSLAVVGGIATQGFVAQRRRVDWRSALTLGGFGVIGTFPGTALSQHLPGRLLLGLFAFVMLVAAVAMLRAKSTEIQRASASFTIVAATGIALGFLTGFLGVGGGFLIVPALVLAVGLTMPTAVATSLVVIALNSLVSLVARAQSLAATDWTIVMWFLIGGVAGSIVGAAVGRRMNQQLLKKIFAYFVIAIALFTGASAADLITVSFK